MPCLSLNPACLSRLLPLPHLPHAPPLILQASFEETNDILFRAATYAERDIMAGVSENILMGQLVPVGTGAFSLLIDEEKLAGVWRFMRVPALRCCKCWPAGWVQGRAWLAGAGAVRSCFVHLSAAAPPSFLTPCPLLACITHPPIHPPTHSTCPTLCLQMPSSWTMPLWRTLVGGQASG